MARHAVATLVALATLCLALAPAGLAAQSRGTPPLNGIRVAGEVGAGLVAMPVGFLAGGLLTKQVAKRLGVSEERTSRVAMAGAWTGAALATAAAPWAIGTRGRVTGSYAAALGGAVAGGAGSYLLVRLNDRDGEASRPCRLACSLATVAVFALPSIGATVGFNLSRRYER